VIAAETEMECACGVVAESTGPAWACGKGGNGKIKILFSINDMNGVKNAFLPGVPATGIFTDKFQEN
jgi:hypothetical protein